MDDDYDEFGNYIGSSSNGSRLKEDDIFSSVTSPSRAYGTSASASATEDLKKFENSKGNIDMFGDDENEDAGAASAHEHGRGIHDIYNDDAQDARSFTSKSQMKSKLDEDMTSYENNNMSNAIVLHEDKVYYPDAKDVYPKGVQILVEDEDRMSIETPIIVERKEKSFAADDSNTYGTSKTKKVRFAIRDESSVSVEMLEDKSDVNILNPQVALPGMKHRQDAEVQYQKSEAPSPSASVTAAHIETPEEKSTSFMSLLMQNPELIRNVSVAGHLHHGKTKLVDLMLYHHCKANDLDEFPSNFTDTRKDEQERKMSIKTTPVSVTLPNTWGKHYLINALDCPGHINFSDDVSASFRVSDGLILVVDAVEGLMMNSEHVIKHAIENRLSIILVITKIDRLIHELKLPPNDAYFKLNYIIQQVNRVMKQAADLSGELASWQDLGLPQKDLYKIRPLSPEKGNVCFAAGENGQWCFSLHSFVQNIYRNQTKADFSSRLWGDNYYDEESGEFTKDSNRGKRKRAFVHFVLEPLYKIYAHVLGEEPKVLGESVLNELGIKLSPKEFSLDPEPLLNLVLHKFLDKSFHGLVDACVEHIPDPKKAAMLKALTTYSGWFESGTSLSLQSRDNHFEEIRNGISTCDPNGPLMINIVKLFSSPDATSFRLFGRVLSGTIRANQSIRILGEKFNLLRGDDEDCGNVNSVGNIGVGQGRYFIPMSSVSAGNWVMLLNNLQQDPLDAHVAKTATITDTSDTAVNGAFIFHPLRFYTQSTIKLAIEPLKPSELPKMLHGLRCVSKSYPLVSTKVEESGEHVLFGTGELYLDCVMYDLREMYADIEIKVADPSISLRETVTETSFQKCDAMSPNKKNKIAMIASPLDQSIALDMELGYVQFGTVGPKGMSSFFRKRYNWDRLAANSIWAFGPESSSSASASGTSVASSGVGSTLSTNILLNESLSTGMQKDNLIHVRDSIVQGFQWGSREGPLCEEPMRSTSFKIIDASICNEPIYRGGGQIIPASRRVVYSSFLSAKPRIMEPILKVEVLTPKNLIPAIKKVLSRRRGHTTLESPIPGTPFSIVKGFIPVLDSFGFEVDLRVHTNGAAFCTSTFDHYDVAPGDPLDSSIVLQPLEPSPPQFLGRELLIKTRRRKGLSDDVSIAKYQD